MLAGNDQDSGHPAVCGSVRCRGTTSELKISEANAGAKLPECTSASQ